MTPQELHKGTNYMLKKAESGFFGRYFNMGSLPNQAALESDPIKTIGLRSPASLVNQVNPLAGVALSSPLEMAVRRMSLGGTTHERKLRLDEADKTLRSSSYGQNIGKMVRNTAPTLTGFGALAGGLAGAAFLPRWSEGLNGEDQDNLIKNVLMGGTSGALGGLIGGTVGGAGAGAVQKFVSNNTSKESKERAKAMVAKHPYATALPFGNLIGATLA